MSSPSKNTSRNKAALFIQANTVFVICVAITVMIGWVVHDSFVVQLRPQYSSMKFNSAMSLAFCGIALLALERNRCRLAIVATMCGMALPLATVFEYVSGINLGIDQLLVSSFMEDRVKYIGRMAPNTAVSILLINVGVIGYALGLHTRRYGELWLAMIGSIVAALAIVPLVGYMGGIESAHTWGDFAGMSLHAAICLLLLGLSSIIYAWKRSPNDPKWLPILIAIGFVVMALSIWLAVETYEDIRFEQSLQMEADYIAGRGNDRLVAFYGAIDRMSGRWIEAKGTPRGLWESDAQSYLKAYPFLRTIEWVDKNAYLQWIVPTTGSEKLAGVKLNTEGTRAETARIAFETHKSRVSNPVDLLQGGLGFIYMSPLFVEDRFEGYIVAAFNLDEVFNRILQRDKAGPFYVKVMQDGVTLFSNEPTDFESSERWHKKAVMKNGDNVWTINVDATPELLKHKNSPLPNLVLVTGLLTSIFATFSVLLALRSRRNAEALRKNEDRLHQVIDAYSLLTVHDFDVVSFMEAVASRMQELTSASGAAIEMIDGDEMVYQATSGSLESFKGFRIKRAGSLSGFCTERQEIMISPDTSQDPRVNAEACRKVGANCMVVVPLARRGAVVGVLKVVSEATHAFTDSDVQSLQLMAVLLGGALGQQLEMDRRMKLEDKLRHMAQHDSLTGLPNRALFKDRLTQALLNHKRSGKVIAVMYMDIDKFKGINDKYGHADGDALLKLFAERISSILRKGDTLARLGGDEFTLIADNMDDKVSAENIAHKIFEVMKTPFILPSVTLEVGISVGIATSSKKETSYDEILACADEALYEVKRAGRNAFRITHIS